MSTQRWEELDVNVYDAPKKKKECEYDILFTLAEQQNASEGVEQGRPVPGSCQSSVEADWRQPLSGEVYLPWVPVCVCVWRTWVGRVSYFAHCDETSLFFCCCFLMQVRMWCFMWLRWSQNSRLGPRRVVEEIRVLSRAKEGRKARRRRSRRQETFLFKERKFNSLGKLIETGCFTRISFFYFYQDTFFLFWPPKENVGNFHFFACWPQ